MKKGCFTLLFFSLEWTPLVLVMLIYFDFAMGFGNIPFILLGEILPQESCSLGNTLVFISTNTFRLEILSKSEVNLTVLSLLMHNLSVVCH